MKQICLCFPNKKRLTRFTIKKARKVVFKKNILSFSRSVIFTIKFYRYWYFYLSGTGTSFTIYSASSLVQVVIVFEFVQAFNGLLFHQHKALC